MLISVADPGSADEGQHIPTFQYTPLQVRMLMMTKVMLITMLGKQHPHPSQGDIHCAAGARPCTWRSQSCTCC